MVQSKYQVVDGFRADGLDEVADELDGKDGDEEGNHRGED